MAKGVPMLTNIFKFYLSDDFKTATRKEEPIGQATHGRWTFFKYLDLFYFFG